MKRLSWMAALCAVGCWAALSAAAREQEPAPAWATKTLRAGIIGTDTSHVPEFTKAFKAHPEWKITVVAAYKGGSPDIPLSANRLEGFARTISSEYGVELVDSIEALLPKVDVVLLESVDGRPHLAQATPVFKAKKPLFIDKPLAASLDDARKIVALARQTGTPLFSTSSVRYHPDLARLHKDAGVGKVTRVETNYVLNKMEHHPDLFYYGIHGVEALYAVMGRGCDTLTRKVTTDGDVTSCTWKDGRVGVYHALPKANASLPLLTVTGERGTATTSGSTDYSGLLLAVAQFFQTGRSPVELDETLEVIQFMTAADRSKEQGGAPVKLSEVR